MYVSMRKKEKENVRAFCFLLLISQLDSRPPLPITLFVTLTSNLRREVSLQKRPRASLMYDKLNHVMLFEIPVVNNTGYDEMKDTIIAKDAKLSAMKNTIAVSLLERFVFTHETLLCLISPLIYRSWKTMFASPTAIMHIYIQH